MHRIRVVLSLDDYRKACDAHRNRRRVTVTGLLQQDSRSKMFDLVDPLDFEVRASESVVT